MRTFLTSLIEVSLTMSAVIAVLLLLGRALEKRFTPQWRYWAWLVVALRLCVPVNVSLPQAPVVLPAPPQAAVRLERPVAPAAGGPALTWNTSPQAGERGPLYRAGDDPGQTVEVRRIPAEQLLFALWCAGCAGFLVVQFGGYLTFRRRVKRWSRPAGEYDGLPVRTCDAVDSPLLMGLFRPVILVPAAGADDFALLHEARHARRRDLWYKLLLVLCNAVHWFNPLAWALRRAAAWDVEIACDAALLKGKDEDYRRAYGQALLRTVAAGRMPGAALTSSFSGGKNSLKQRFASLMDVSPKKAGRAALALLCAAVLLAGTMVACGGGKGLTVPENGTVYASTDMSDRLDNSGDHEAVTLTVVDYDRAAGVFNSRSELSHTFTMAEEVTIHHDTTGGADTVVAGEPGSQERNRELSSALGWPMLSSVFYDNSTWLLELHLTDGKVDELGWFIHENRFPEGDLYDEASGLYYSPYVGAGTVVPEELRGSFSVAHSEDGEPGAWFYASAEQNETEKLFEMTRTQCTMLGSPDGVKNVLFDQWFLAGAVQLLNSGEEDVYDPVSGARLTLPGELTGGLVLISARSAAGEIGVNGRKVETDDGSWLLCLHREMLGQLSVPEAVANRSGVFALGLVPWSEDPFWAFGWEGRYPWLELSDGAREQCGGLMEAREDITASLDASASALLAQDWVTGVEYLDRLPAENGTVAYQNDTFGFTMEFPAETAEHLMAVTMDRGEDWVYLGTAVLEAESSGPIPPELEARTEAMSEAMNTTGRSVTFVDRRLMARLGEEYALQALSGGWTGRIVVCAEPDAPLTALDELESGGGYRFYYAPTLLTKEGLELAEIPAPQGEQTAVLQIVEEVEAAARALRPPASETRTPLERFVPDGLTAIFDGPRENDPGDVVINWYRLRLTFHFDGTQGVDLNESRLSYRLEFEDDSALLRLMGINPFTGGGRVEGGEDALKGAIDFTMGGNTMTEERLRALVAEDPSCTLLVTDQATGESRTFPLEARYDGGGGQVVYALDASYDAATDTLSYHPIRVDERDMSFEEPGGAGEAVTLIGETVPLADGVRLIGGYEAEGEGVQAFLDSRVLFSTAPMGLRLTIKGGEITALEWVWLQPPAGESAEARGGVVHEVDSDGKNVSGFWLNEGGAIDFDAPFSLPVSKGSNIQLLDGEGKYGEPAGLKELEARIAPLSAWGLACELSMLDGAVCGIVEAG